jgi:uncharacterized protein YdeI (BOF family)
LTDSRPKPQHLHPLTLRLHLLAALINNRTKAQLHSTPPPLTFELQDLNPQADGNLSPFSAFQNSIIVNSSTDPSNISSFSELPLNPHTPVHFDSLTGMLIVQGDNQDNILHESISTQGYYELNLDGLLFSSDANSTHYSQELAGATRETVKALSFNGGLGQDTLILDRQNLNQALHITADDEVDIQGNITSKSDIQITADQINLNAKIKANSVVFNAANILNQGEIKTKGSTDITFSDRYIDMSLSVITGKKISITGGATGNLETRGKFVAKEISLLGNQVSLLGANLDATSKSGGGTVLIGGDYQGKGVERGIVNAMNTVVDKNTVIRADALSNGNGGKVIIWSDQKTIFEGSVSTKGGSISGDGGFVEVSGKHQLKFAGQVDMSATNGKLGTLLLDPDDYYIGPDDGDENTFDISDLEKIKGNLFFSAANNVTFNASVNFVNSTGTITIQADSDGDGVGTVSLNGAFSSGGRNINISGGNVSTNSYVFSAGGFINVTAQNTIAVDALYSGSNGIGGNIIVNSTSGNVNLGSISTSSANTSGAVVVLAKSSITFEGSISTYSQYGNGGSVFIQANNRIILTGGVSSGSTTKKGGAVTVNSLESSIKSDSIFSFGKTTSGNVKLSSHDEIDLGNSTIYTEAGGKGGSITLDAGTTITTGFLTAVGSGQGAEVKLTAKGNILTSNIRSFSDGKGANITVVSKEGNIDITNASAYPDTGVYISAFGVNGNGGAITLDAYGDITTNDIHSESFNTGSGGTVKLTSQNGKIDLRQNNISTNANQGNGGMVEIHAYKGSITGVGVLTNATTGNGGKIILDALNDITGGGIVSNSFAKNAGIIEVTSAEGNIDFGTKGVGANSKQGNAGSITLTAKSTTNNRKITTGLIDAGADGNGNGGAIKLTAQGDIFTSTVVTNSNGTGRSGRITLTSTAGGINTTNDSPDTTNRVIFAGTGAGTAGTVTLTAYGDIVTRSVFAGAETGIGSTVSLTSQTGGIDTGDGYITIATNGKGTGNVILNAVKDIKVGNISSNSTLDGKGGNITAISTEGGVTILDVNTSSKVLAAGYLKASAKLGIKVGNVDTSANDNGNAGNVVLTAANDIEAGAIKANVFGNGTGIGGAVKFVSQLGSISTEYVRTDSVGAKGGNITLDAGSKISGGAGGNVKVTGAFDIDGAEVSLFAGIRDGVAINVKHHAQMFDVGDATENGTKGLIMAAASLVADYKVNYGFKLASSINVPEIVFLSTAANTQSSLEKNVQKLALASLQTEYNRLVQEVFQQVYASLLVFFGAGTSSKLPEYVDRLSTLLKAETLTEVAALKDSKFKNYEELAAKLILPDINRLLVSAKKYSVTDSAQIAYILATASHETLFGHTIEFLGASNSDRNNGMYEYAKNKAGNYEYYQTVFGVYLPKAPLGSQNEFLYFQEKYGYNSDPDFGHDPTKNLVNGLAVDGYAFRGRGYVQLTWKANYDKFGKDPNFNMNFLTITPPDGQNQAPETWKYAADIVATDRNLAADITVYGMKKDLFISKYPSNLDFGGFLDNVNSTNMLQKFTDARTLVNANDSAAEIAGNAVIYFQALKDSVS